MSEREADWTADTVSRRSTAASCQPACPRGLYSELIHADLTEYLRGMRQAFDLIVAGDTFPYVGALDEVLSLAADALRPGGTLIFTVNDATKADAPPYLASIDEVTIPDAEADAVTLTPRGRYVYTARYVDRVVRAAHLRPEIVRAHLRIEAANKCRGS
jgi:predicted TPR repeat methyltransferase